MHIESNKQLCCPSKMLKYEKQVLELNLGKISQMAP